MISKEAGIDIIVSDLKVGSRKVDIMAKFGKNWQTSKDTFNKWYIEAKKQRKEAQEPIKKRIEDIEVNSQIELQIELNITVSEIVTQLVNDIKDLRQMLKNGYIIKKISINGKEEIKKEIFGISETAKIHEMIDRKIKQLRELLGLDAAKKIENTIIEGINIIIE